jgi:hypothetical protein
MGWWTAVKACSAWIELWLQSLDAQQASVGGEADLPQSGQVGQSFPDSEVAGVVDGGVGAQCSSVFVILLDRGVLVVDVHTRGDPLK